MSKQNFNYKSPDTFWSTAEEENILCQSSTIPDLTEGESDFTWV